MKKRKKKKIEIKIQPFYRIGKRIRLINKIKKIAVGLIGILTTGLSIFLNVEPLIKKMKSE